jgi:two-component system, NtrC family, sensor kinase
MKFYLVFFLWIITCNWGMSQTNDIDSLKQALTRLKTAPGFEKDTNYIKTLSELGFQLLYINPDSTKIIADQTITLSKKINFPKGEVDGLKNLGAVTNVQGNYNQALSIFDEALLIGEKANYPFGSAGVYQNKGMVYFNLGKYPESLESFYAALRLREQIADSIGISSSINGIGTIYFMQGKYEEALEFYLKALTIAEKFNFNTGVEAFAANIGEVMVQLKRYEEALEYLLKSEKITALTGNMETMAFIQFLLGTAYLQQGDFENSTQAFLYCNQLAKDLGSQEYLGRSLLGLARVSLAEGNIRKSESYSRELLDIATQIGYHELLRDGSEILSKILEDQGNDRQSLFYFKMFKQYADSINNQDTERRAAILAAEYEYAQKEILLKSEQEKKELEYQKRTNFQRWVIFSVFAALISSIIISLISYRNRKKEEYTNHLLHTKNEEIILQKQGLEEALSNLKSTQAQLIQQEKLASLGQLTAGIAHEIKNPLNFVNNFSEVSIEMIEEVIDSRLKTQDTRPKTEADEIEDEILEDIKANLEKIHEHGSRANGIVTSMLQHSRGGSGKKEPTDLNSMIKEYVNLSFHGMRAGKNPIEVEIALELDDTIKEIPLVREDFTRVIINLCNNAFDAIRSKVDLTGFKNLSGLEPYHPKLTVRTKSEKDRVLIAVEDNGPGIPDEIKDKILQPFFTTKKGTEGTGLGLSITHDIIKAHGGHLSMESILGDGPNHGKTGATFIISLPLA